MTDEVPRLDGRRVAVTRGRGGEDGLTARLRDLGAEVLEFPSIAAAPPSSWEALDAALAVASTFDWIAFASVTAVDATLGRLVSLGATPPPVGTRIAAVGKATAARLRERLREPDLVPPTATGEALAAALAPQAFGRKVLVPRAEDGRTELLEGLAAAGADVVAAPCYRTVPAPPEALAPLGDALLDGRVDAVAFASPSAVQAVVAALGLRAELLERAALAAIGPTTAEAIRKVGLRVAVVPPVSTARDLADAIARHLGPRGPGGPGRAST